MQGQQAADSSGVLMVVPSWTTPTLRVRASGPELFVISNTIEVKTLVVEVNTYDPTM